MVVTGSIERAVQVFGAGRSYLQERRSPFLPIVAFSGEHDFAAGPVSEASLNGFPSSEITSRIQEDPYRFLICADKFQTATTSRCCRRCMWTNPSVASRPCRPSRA
jgi:type I restriction enzyme R subunit